jgi:hypothetical protein
MRNLKLYLLSSLLLSASQCFSNFSPDRVGNSTGESRSLYEAQQKARKEERISCVPQRILRQSLEVRGMRCGNQFNDLVIVKQEEFNGLEKWKQ